ncbi:MAG: terminase small subunit [Lachnospiraceae bacterium]|nr:terminase small subunit [Lachnospiraceae bacterium]
MAENYIDAEQDYMRGMKYKDIAAKYGVTINTVKSWKQRYEWSKGGKKEGKKGVHTKQKKVCTQNQKSVHTKNRCKMDDIDLPEDGTRETLENEELTEKQRLFCIYYSRTFNATQSYQKAYGCSYAAAMTSAHDTLRNPKIKSELNRLKEIKRQQVLADEADIVELQMRIAFSDIGDFVTFGQENVPVIGQFGPVEVKDPKTGEKTILSQDVNVVRFKESDHVDTQLIQEAKNGRNGASIKLADRQKAIDWLTKYFLLHPEDKYRAEFEKRRMKNMGGDGDDQYEDDGLLDVLNDLSGRIFEDGDSIVET